MSVQQLLPPIVVAHHARTTTPGLSTDSSPTSPSRMHIHIDMSSHAAFLSRSHDQGAIHIDTSFGSGGAFTSGPAPTAAAYASPELSSAVSSFNPPATTDSSLLTPISSAHSPPLDQQPNKPMHHFSAPVTTGAQQHSPPLPSDVYFTPYGGQTTSSSASPMTVATSDMEMPYPSLSGSPKDEMPPHAPYYGAFGVSGSSDMDGYHPSPHSMYTVDPSEVSSYYHRAGSHGPMMPQRLPPTPGQGPQHILARSPYPPGRGMAIIEDLGIKGQFSPHLGGGARSQSNKNPRRKSGPKRPSNRKPARASGTERNTPPYVPDPNAPRLRLSDKATEEEKYLFELRSQNLGEKGKGMWEQIQKLYAARFGGDPDKAMLQMKVSRAVLRWGIWPQEEIDILLKVFHEDEQARFDRILERMKSLNGCRAWDWKARHIEAELVKIGLMEATLDDESKVRRKKRTDQRKRSQEAIRSQNALNLLAMQQQHGHFYMPHHANGLHGVDLHSQLTPEQENDLVDQIESKYPHDHDMGSPDSHHTGHDGLRHHSVHSLGGDHDVEIKMEVESTAEYPEDTLDKHSHAQSARVAQQAIGRMTGNGLH